MKEGLFIVIYGINNIGKSTQVGLLTEAFSKAKLESEQIKYPVYDLKPTGPQINEILRGGNPQNISENEFQELYAQNRRDYQPLLCKKIVEGVNMVAEDYIGTGMAWGLTKGADLEHLLAINKGLVKPDVEILLDGDRFSLAKEAGHQHENNDQLIEECRKQHLELAARFGWVVVNANQEVEDVHQDILKIVEEKVKELKKKRKLLAFFGYPGSGKTTLINEFILKNPEFKFFDVYPFIQELKDVDGVVDETRTLEAYEKFYKNLNTADENVIMEIGTGHPGFNLKCLNELSDRFSVIIIFCLLDSSICRQRCLHRAEADPERDFKLDSLDTRLARIFPDEHEKLAKDLKLECAELDMILPMEKRVNELSKLVT